MTNKLITSIDNYCSNYMDSFTNMNDVTLAMLEDVPTKIFCLINSLLSTTTHEAQN